MFGIKVHSVRMSIFFGCARLDGIGRLINDKGTYLLDTLIILSVVCMSYVMSYSSRF